MNVDIDNFAQIKRFIYERDLIRKVIRQQHRVKQSVLIWNSQELNLKIIKDKEMNIFHLKDIKRVANKFSIIQCGITFFLHQNDIVAYPFNFYLFPKENSFRDPLVILQGSSIQFNTKQKMDWTRWITKGINYVKISEIQMLKDGYNNKTFDEMKDSLYKDERQTLDFLITRIKYIKERQQIIEKIPKTNSYSIKKILEKYIFDKNLNIIVTILQQKGKIISDLTQIHLKYITHQQKKILKQKFQEQTIGFTEIFKEIWINSKAIFVGHNCFYDLLFMYEAFIAPLPQKYKDFKNQLSKSKHQFYDTKCIIELYENKNEIFKNGTSLEEIYSFMIANQQKLLNSKPKIVLAHHFQKYDLKNQILHEAGFDSYLTGWVFYLLAKKFQNSFQKECNGKINLNRSYFEINIQKSDNLKSDINVFVFMFANEYMQKEQLKKVKQENMKALKQFMSEQKVIQYVTIYEGLKQIYISLKENSKLYEVVSILSRLNRKQQRVCSLIRFIEMKALYYSKHLDKM